jgi:hypothetical protein
MWMHRSRKTAQLTLIRGDRLRLAGRGRDQTADALDVASERGSN